MTLLSTTVWLPLMILMALSYPVNTLRRSPRRHRGSRSRSQQREQSWVPEIFERPGTSELSGTSGSSWLPLNVVEPQHTQLSQDTWLPQQIAGTLPAGSWAPVDIEQTQQRIPWLSQRPRTSNCTFHYDGVPRKYIHPFLVDTQKREFVYPDIVLGQQIVTLKSGSTVLASCPGGGNYLVRNNRPREYITCRNSQLYHGGTPVTWSDLGCYKKNKPTLKAGKRCGGKDRRIHYIGWKIRRGLFLPQITVCFNTKLETSVYASHTLHGRFIDAKVVEPRRPSFKTNRMFSVSLRRHYMKAEQVKLARQILRSTKELSGKGQHFLAKGHLAPDADFVLEAEQDATYYYINAVPQWQAVNNGNWKRLEFAVRELAERREATLDVYTGTQDVLELPDHHHHPTKVFLGGQVVPVPALMWKVIHDPASHTAVVIVVLNDVKDRSSPPDSRSWGLRACSNVCSRLAWVDWNINDVTQGQSFCCNLDDLRSAISDLPSLGRVGLLV